MAHGGVGITYQSLGYMRCGERAPKPVMKAPPRPLSQKRAADGLLGVCAEPGCMSCRRQQARHGALPTFLLGPRASLC